MGFPDRGRARGVEDVDGASQIDPVRGGPFLGRLLDRGDGGHVEAAVHARHGGPHGRGVGDAAEDDLGPVRGVLALAGRQVVQDAHRMARRNQRVRQVRADETAPARHQLTRHTVLPDAVPVPDNLDNR